MRRSNYAVMHGAGNLQAHLVLEESDDDCQREILSL